jgi:hypothetical protein
MMLDMLVDGLLGEDETLSSRPSIAVTEYSPPTVISTLHSHPK